MQFNTETFGMAGTLEIWITPKGAPEPFLFYKGKNRITNVAREHLLRLTVENPATLAPNPIVEFRVGEGGVGQAPTGAETSLYNEISPTSNYTTNVAYALSGGNMVAEYSFDLTTDEANGFNISEVGLFAANDWLGSPAAGKMFNIKTFPELVKTASFSVTFLWKINYSGATA